MREMDQMVPLRNLTPPQLPLSLHFPGATTQPQLRRLRSVMSTVLHSRSIHAQVSASSMPECCVKFRVLDEFRDLKFSYREIKFSKNNIPSKFVIYQLLQPHTAIITADAVHV